MIEQQAYRVTSGYGPFGKDKPFVAYEHILTKYVGEDSVAVCEDYNETEDLYHLQIFIVSKSCLKKIKTVNQIPFEDIKVGDRCISAIGNAGTITSISRKFEGRYNGNIVFEWENGNKSEGPYELSDCPWYDSVEYIGAPDHDQTSA